MADNKDQPGEKNQFAPRKPDSNARDQPSHEGEQDQHQHDFLDDDGPPKQTWIPTLVVVMAALAVGCFAIARSVYNPRTDDCEVFANLIGMAPQVDGPITQLPIRDNQFVKQGDLLFQIYPRPYQYALERATSDQAALEGQIEDRR